MLLTLIIGSFSFGGLLYANDHERWGITLFVVGAVLSIVPAVAVLGFLLRYIVSLVSRVRFVFVSNDKAAAESDVATTEPTGAWYNNPRRPLADDLRVAFKVSGERSYRAARQLLEEFVSWISYDSMEFYGNRVDDVDRISLHDPVVLGLDNLNEHIAGNVRFLLSSDYCQEFSVVAEDEIPDNVVEEFVIFYVQYLGIVSWMRRLNDVARPSRAKLERNAFKAWAEDDADFAKRVVETVARYQWGDLPRLVDDWHWIHKWARDVSPYALRGNS